MYEDKTLKQIALELLQPELGLEVIIDEYVKAQPDDDKDDWYVSTRTAANSILSGFIDYLTRLSKPEQTATVFEQLSEMLPDIQTAIDNCIDNDVNSKEAKTLRLLNELLKVALKQHENQISI